MLFHSTEQFIREVLPGIAQGNGRLAAYFISYQEVRGYPSGPVETGNANLRIVVQNGYKPLCPERVGRGIAAVLADDLEALAETGDETVADGRDAQARVEAELDGSVAVAEEERLFALVYAGFSAFDESLAFVRKLRRNRPDATIAVLTCTCDFEEFKRFAFERLSDEGVVNAVIIASRCGGKDDQRAVLEALMAR